MKLMGILLLCVVMLGYMGMQCGLSASQGVICCHFTTGIVNSQHLP